LLQNLQVGSQFGIYLNKTPPPQISGIISSVNYDGVSSYTISVATQTVGIQTFIYNSSSKTITNDQIGIYTLVPPASSSVPPQASASASASSVPPQANASASASSVPPQANASASASSVPPQANASASSSVPPQANASASSSVPPQANASASSSVPPQANASVSSSVPPQANASASSSVPPQASASASSSVPPQASASASSASSSVTPQANASASSASSSVPPQANASASSASSSVPPQANASASSASSSVPPQANASASSSVPPQANASASASSLPMASALSSKVVCASVPELLEYAAIFASMLGITQNKIAPVNGAGSSHAIASSISFNNPTGLPVTPPIASNRYTNIDSTVNGYQDQDNLYNNNQFLIDNIQNEMAYMSIDERLEVQKILTNQLKTNNVNKNKNKNPFTLESYSTNSSYYMGTDPDARVAYFFPNNLAFNNVIYRYKSDESPTNPPVPFVIKMVMNISNYIFITAVNDYTSDSINVIYNIKNDTIIDPAGSVLKSTSQHEVVPFVFNSSLPDPDKKSRTLDITNNYEITAYPQEGFNIQDASSGNFLIFDVATNKYIESRNSNYAPSFKVIKDNINLDEYSVSIQNILSTNFIKYDPSTNTITEDVFKIHDRNYGWILKIAGRDNYIIYSVNNNKYLSANGKNVTLSDTPTVWKLKNILN